MEGESVISVPVVDSNSYPHPPQSTVIPFHRTLELTHGNAIRYKKIKDEVFELKSAITLFVAVVHILVYSYVVEMIGW